MAKRDQEKKRCRERTKIATAPAKQRQLHRPRDVWTKIFLTELSLQTSIFKSHDSSFSAFFFFFFLFIFSGFSPIHFSSSMPNWATHVAAKHATTATTATTAIRLLCTGQAIGLKPSSGRTKREKR